MKIISSILVLTLIVFAVNIDAAHCSDAIETAGDVGFVAIPAAAAIMTLVKSDKEGSWQFIKVFATTAVLTEGLKYAIHEKRPNGDQHSFPSGHTSAAFAGAGFIQQRYGWTYGAPAYIAASFVGYSRIESKNHYYYDVLAGAAIGIGANLVFTKPFKTLTVTPIAGNGVTGVMIGKSF